ncbi:MAG: hypothetical protein K2Y30_16055 [Flavobacteriaceae bacterium]|nr:hypothetical protein [Flavobacteriaceae bacterium]
MKVIVKEITKLIALFFLFNGNLFAQTRTEKETATVSTGHTSISIQVKRYKSYLEVRVFNTNSTKTYKVNFSVKVTLRSDKKEYEELIKSVVTLKPNTDGFGMSTGSHFANSATREIFSTLVDAEMIYFDWEEISTTVNSNTSNSSTFNNTSKSPTDYLTSSTTETRYNTNPIVKEAVERQNRLNTLQKGQANAQKVSQDWSRQNEIRSQQYKKEQQELTNAVVNVTTELVNMFQQNARDKEEREERERQSRLKREQEEFTRKQVLANKIASRKAIIEEFPSRSIPLSSQEKAPKIYYFIYACDKSLNDEYGATVYLSNVFEIAKFNDGTWPYQNMINNEILTLTANSEVLHGYYYTQEEADNLRNSFITLLRNLDVNISDIYYIGKPNANAATNRVVRKVGESKYGKTIKINDQNFAPATLNPTKKGAINIRTDKEKLKENKYGKTIKID